MVSNNRHSERPSLAARRRGQLLVLLAVLLWSTSGLFAKSHLFEDWLPATRGLLFSFWRVGFAGFLLIFFVRQRQWTWRLVPTTTAFAVMNITFLSAVVLTTAANAIWLQATAPLWVFLFSVAVLHYRVRGRDWLLLFCCGAGISIILANELGGANRTGVVMGLLSGVSFGAVVLCIRWLRDVDAAWITSVNFLVAAAVALPFIWWNGAWQTPSAAQFLALAAFGILQMGLPYVLLAKGLRTISSWDAAAIAILEPVLMPLWVFLLYRERPAGATIIGASLIFAGLVAKHLCRESRNGPL